MSFADFQNHEDDRQADTAGSGWVFLYLAVKLGALAYVLMAHWGWL